MDSSLTSIPAPKKLQIAVFPWLAFGHMIPFLEVAKLIAQKGHHVYFISTPRNIDRLPKLPSHLLPFITFVKLPFPADQNLPENAEATSDIPLDKMPYLKKAHDELQQPLSDFLESNSSLDWIIYDFAPFWLPPMAAKQGIRQVFFSIFNAWTCCSFSSTTEAMINGYDPRSEPEHFTVPPKWVTFPTKLAFRLHDAKKWISFANQQNVSGVSDFYRCGLVIQGCDLLAIRSCMELEPEWLNLYGDLHRKQVVPLGLLPLSVEGQAEKDDSWVEINMWMDEQGKESVVYVALGSEFTLSQQELTELALGLELSGLPFFWALRIRKGLDATGSEQPSLKLPEGFEDRVKGRGIVWTRWAPQLRILNHESVGGFLTHCGWSSIIEGLLFGCPLVMLPFMVDQGLNATVMEERNIGVVVPRKDDEDGLFTRDDVAESLRLVMADEQKEGKSSYREEARKMAKLFGDRELHQKYMDDFIKQLLVN